MRSLCVLAIDCCLGSKDHVVVMQNYRFVFDARPQALFEHIVAPQATVGHHISRNSAFPFAKLKG